MIIRLYILKKSFFVKKIDKGGNIIKIDETINEKGEIISKDGKIIKIIDKGVNIIKKNITLIKTGDITYEIIEFNYLDIKEKIDIIKQIENGLNYLHENDIFHGDLAFKNILYEIKDNKNIYKITDFGLSKILKAENIKVFI